MRDELLEIYEAAERLGITQTMLQAWITKRRVAVVKFGPGNGAVRVRASEVERLINQATIPARPAAAPAPKDFNQRG
jgi:excisionase family DNA binding protein